MSCKPKLNNKTLHLTFMRLLPNERGPLLNLQNRYYSFLLLSYILYLNFSFRTILFIRRSVA